MSATPYIVPMAEIPTTTGFKRLIISALIVPIGLMIVIAVLLLVQIKGLLESVQSVEKSDVLIATANRVEKLTLDLETGLRGYMLTTQASFLDPFLKSRETLARESTTLHKLLSDEPDQLSKFDEIERLRGEWLAFADRTIKAMETGGDHLAESRAQVGKGLMDQSRRKFAELITAAETIRDQRVRSARSASRNTLLTVGGVTILGGAFLAWLARRQFIELASTYQTALDKANQLTATLEQRVTERTQLLEERSVQLTEANRELEAFAYSISHDLRAPMRHITGFSDLLRKSAGPNMSPDDNENLGIIHDTAKNAGRMVDDLLALSRIGRQQLKKTDVDMNDLVQQVIRELAPETRDRQVKWRIAPLPSAYGDASLLRLVLHNLLSNALKYSSKKSNSLVEMKATRDETNITYSIHDNGEGFDMQYAHKLFGVFQRLHRSEEFEGTGIGLANVRRIIIRHGGRVWAEGQLGQGATFFFSLPLNEPRTV